MEIFKEIFMCLLYITGILLAILAIIAIVQTMIDNIRPKKISKSASKYIAELEKEVDEVIDKIFKDKEDK